MAENLNKNQKERKLRVADLKVRLKYSGARLEKQSLGYVDDWTGEADVDILVDNERLKKFCDKDKTVSMNLAEYMLTGTQFYSKLIDYSGFMLHSSAVVYEGKAYLFSASCGTGKSTHTSLWLKRFGDAAVILNDDKPAIRLVNDKFYAYGTPWSGKTDKQTNMCVPIAAIAFIEQSENNSITRMDTKTAITSILSQTLKLRNISMIDFALPTIEKLVKSINVYKLRCNMELDAVDVAYEAMSKNL